MSSVSWKKIHIGSELGALVYHNSRHDSRKDVSYRNQYINPAKTKNNYMVGPGLRYSKISGKSELERLNRRIEEIDKALPPKRRRKDRVVAISYCVTVPEGLPEDQEREFFKIAYDRIAEMSGGINNCSRGWVHVDEIHTYTEPITGIVRESKTHMHVVGIPFIPGVGINGSKFETQDRMRNLNKNIDEDCKKQLGLPFLTGNYRPFSGLSVEELQAASVTQAQKDAQEAAEHELNRTQALVQAEKEQLSQVQQELDETKKKKAAAEEERAAAEAKVDALKRDYEGLAGRFNNLVRLFNALLEKVQSLGVVLDTRLFHHQNELTR